MRTEARGFGLVAIAIAAVAAADPDAATEYFDDNTDRVPLHTVMPGYPHEARRDRIEGEVQVCFHIDRRGRPYRIAARHSTHRIFEKPARRAVRRSTWLPLAAGAKVPGIKACRTFQFRLAPLSPARD
jgi:TonB family protein